MKRLALMLLLAVAASGCGEEPVVCTEIGCTDGFTLELVADSEEFTAGVYNVDVELDGEAEECAFEVRMVCEGGGPCVVNEDCNATYGVSEISILYGGTPGEVTYSITRDGLQIASDSIEPEYQTVQPNGPECPPTCMQATELVSIP
jgi:hypothetical protein